MKLFGFEITKVKPEPEIDAKGQVLTLDQLIQRLEAAMQTISGIQVTPETAAESPTVQAVVRAIATRIATLPVHVYEKTSSNGQESKELLPNHPITRLLNRPNDHQDRVTFWLDATSWLVRYGNFYAFKSRGQTGPIRRLEPLPPAAVTPSQDDDLRVTYKVSRSRGDFREYASGQILHARGPARDGFVGDSPVMDVRESIALEIAAERFGASFFGNGAMPLMMFKYMAGSAGHQSDEQRKQFIEEFQQAYGQRQRFRAMLLPRGVEAGDPVTIDNDKAQFLQTRKHQRTVIAGAFGVPPHLVGDLERATFSNVEQQSLDFVLNVVLPYVRMFEAAMERDLLTPEDRAAGIIIRFNIDAALRGDFKSRQEGLKIQREAGVISPNEWREIEGRNPREGGDAFWEQGPSGQTSASSPTPAAEPGSDNGKKRPIQLELRVRE